MEGGMKKISVLFLVLIAVIACGNKKDTSPSCVFDEELKHHSVLARLAQSA
jgi:hypothetical protein